MKIWKYCSHDMSYVVLDFKLIQKCFEISRTFPLHLIKNELDHQDLNFPWIFIKIFDSVWLTYPDCYCSKTLELLWDYCCKLRISNKTHKILSLTILLSNSLLNSNFSSIIFIFLCSVSNVHILLELNILHVWIINFCYRKLCLYCQNTVVE